MKYLSFGKQQYSIGYNDDKKIKLNLTPLNKQSLKVKSEFTSRDHGSNSKIVILKLLLIVIFEGVKVVFFSFKRLPLNT